MEKQCILGEGNQTTLGWASEPRRGYVSSDEKVRTVNIFVIISSSSFTLFWSTSCDSLRCNIYTVVESSSDLGCNVATI